MHHIRGTCRAALAAALVLAGLFAGTAIAQARSFHFDIQDQSLSQALQSYGRISGQQIVFTEDLVADRASPSLVGEFTAEAALERLLLGSGLIAERSSAGVLMILRPNPQDSYPAASGSKSNPVPSPASSSQHPNPENPTW